MKHAAIAEPVVRSALTRAARQSIARPIAIAIVGVAAVSLATGMGVSGGFGFVAAFWSALAVAGVGALLSGRLIAGAIADLVVRPTELLLEQLNPRDLDGFSWAHGRALGRPDIAADLKLLQRRIREVTRHSRIVVDELERAREQANHQNLAKSQFLAKMSHELRTPLNAILGYTMLLHEDAADAGNTAAMADLDRIQQAGRNLLALVNDILDLSKFETGHMTVDRVAIDVQALANAVTNACGAADPPNGNRFEMTIGEGVGIMIGDAGKLHRCLANLLSNAFKFTQAGSIMLDIRLAERDGARMIEFVVRDTGIGIAPDGLERLFDVFQQGDVGATRQFGGAGLGLAIVRRLAGLMGGECTAESVPHQGSTFRLLLPLGDAAARISQSGSPSVAAAAFAIVPAAAHTALVIDDDEATIELMQRWLGRMGYNMVSATTADAGLVLARTHRPNFILLEALMPGRSGYDMLEELRGDPDISHIPTILITVEDDPARGLKAGATDYLRKPITERQLSDVLDVYRFQATGEILVIDDDDASAALMERSVAQVGFSARRASNGVEGLEMANASRPDAIILDLAMPVMDGFEVLDRLAASDDLRDVPLVIVSGIDITIDDHRRFAAAGHRFFAKAASTPREIAQSLKELVA